MEEPGSAIGHDPGRGVPDVAFEAPATDRSYQPVALGHHQAGALSPVGGSLDGDDRGHGHSIAPGPAILDGPQDVAEFAHVGASVPPRPAHLAAV